MKSEAKFCPDCGKELVQGKAWKQPNQYDAAFWKDVVVCTRCGEIKKVQKERNIKNGKTR